MQRLGSRPTPSPCCRSRQRRSAKNSALSSPAEVSACRCRAGSRRTTAARRQPTAATAAAAACRRISEHARSSVELPPALHPPLRRPIGLVGITVGISVVTVAAKDSPVSSSALPPPSCRRRRRRLPQRHPASPSVSFCLSFALTAPSWRRLAIFTKIVLPLSTETRIAARRHPRRHAPDLAVVRHGIHQPCLAPVPLARPRRGTLSPSPHRRRQPRGPSPVGLRSVDDRGAPDNVNLDGAAAVVAEERGERAAASPISSSRGRWRWPRRAARQPPPARWCTRRRGSRPAPGRVPLGSRKPVSPAHAPSTSCCSSSLSGLLGGRCTRPARSVLPTGGGRAVRWWRMSAGQRTRFSLGIHRESSEAPLEQVVVAAAAADLARELSGLVVLYTVAPTSWSAACAAPAPALGRLGRVHQVVSCSPGQAEAQRYARVVRHQARRDAPRARASGPAGAGPPAPARSGATPLFSTSASASPCDEYA